jgi:predicted permease
MNESLTVMNAVLPVLAIAVAGLIMRKLNWLTAEADSSLLRVNINLLLPCLILHASIGNAALRDLGNLLLAPAVGFLTAAGGILLAYALRRVAGTRTEAEGRTFGVSVGLYNYSFIPIPLAFLLFGKETVGVLCLYNVGVEMALWTIAVMLISGGSLGGVWRNIINPPLLAIALGLVLNWTGVGQALPPVLKAPIRWLADCAIPMSLILAGATIADHLGAFHARHGRAVIGWALALRLGVLPALFLILAWVLPASVDLQRVIVLQAAMTSAVFPIVMARHYGGDPATAVRVALATSFVGILTIPLWIRFGMNLLGL